MQKYLFIIITSLLFFFCEAAPIQANQARATHNCTGIGVDYYGTVSVTKSNTRCIPWTDFYAHQYRDKHIVNHNYCRNPTYSLKGPYCIVERAGGVLGMERIEHCDIKCEPGFILDTFDKKCDERSISNVINGTNVTMQLCIDHCMTISGCFKAVYTKEYCAQCDKDALLEEATDYIILKYYNTGVDFRCKLLEKDKNDKTMNVLSCEGETESITSPECHIVCAENYKGKVDVECGERKMVFDVKNQCRPYCKLRPVKELKSNYDYHFCDAHVNPIQSDNCRVRCKRTSEWVNATCDVATGFFNIVGECKELLCRFAKNDEKIFDLSKCKNSLKQIKADNCVFSCFGEKSGHIQTSCAEEETLNYNFQCDRLLKSNMISHQSSGQEKTDPNPGESTAPVQKCIIHWDMITSTRFDFTQCKKAYRVPTPINECTIKCKFGDTVLPLGCSSTGFFFATEDCLPRRCRSSGEQQRNFDLTRCDTSKFALFAHNCEAACREGEGAVVVVCPIEGGVFEMADKCDLSQMQEGSRDITAALPDEDDMQPGIDVRI